MKSALTLIARANASPLRTAADHIDSDCGRLSMYCRVQTLYVEGQRRRVFNMARLIIVKARQRGRGIFRESLPFLAAAAANTGLEGLVVEHVHNPRLSEFLKNEGWTEFRFPTAEDDAPSYFKSVEKTHE